MLDKNLLFATLPLLLVAGLALVKGIARLIQALRVDELANLPLAAGGTVDIREAGEVLLSLRGTLSSTDFAGASFALRDTEGKAVPSSMLVLRSLRTGLDGEATLSVRRFQVPVPGRYLLETSGLDPERIAGSSRLVLTRPGGAPLILSVLWVVSAAVVLLASLVFSALSAFAEASAAGVSTPAVGSPARTAILDTVRGELGMAGGSSRFKVFHLKTAGPWAYFEGNEIVHVETSMPPGPSSARRSHTDGMEPIARTPFQPCTCTEA